LRRVVLDTNVLVSGLINPHGAPGRIVAAATDGTLQPAWDDRILGEYEEVLARPKFARLSRLDVATVLDTLRTYGHEVTPLDLLARASAPIVLPDLDDVAFLEVARASRADALVTGNLKDFPSNRRRGVVVVAPARFRW
jgi:putative PIN family toxin of toxin-antitoxin system